LPDDRFFVATDERDPDALQVISDAGDLLEMEDRRAFGWPLMLTDVRVSSSSHCWRIVRRTSTAIY
jgi:sensor domain CHASE-containing protein